MRIDAGDRKDPSCAAGGALTLRFALSLSQNNLGEGPGLASLAAASSRPRLLLYLPQAVFGGGRLFADSSSVREKPGGGRRRGMTRGFRHPCRALTLAAHRRLRPRS